MYELPKTWYREATEGDFSLFLFENEITQYQKLGELREAIISEKHPKYRIKNYKSLSEIKQNEQTFEKERCILRIIEKTLTPKDFGHAMVQLLEGPKKLKDTEGKTVLSTERYTEDNNAIYVTGNALEDLLDSTNAGEFADKLRKYIE